MAGLLRQQRASGRDFTTALTPHYDATSDHWLTPPQQVAQRIGVPVTRLDDPAE
ncbi:hypothetical protein [uncultured Litoreibacter sp.]|uniref:hypothetical protein n=1 Tax=uncultured Litoreibacter sp. TaxID=1392394 RepID=UPI0026378605|nr:hypothetical protein [uncultured Litoreibacter sp.]